MNLTTLNKIFELLLEYFFENIHLISEDFLNKKEHLDDLNLLLFHNNPLLLNNLFQHQYLLDIKYLVVKKQTGYFALMMTQNILIEYLYIIYNYILQIIYLKNYDFSK